MMMGIFWIAKVKNTSYQHQMYCWEELAKVQIFINKHKKTFLLAGTGALPIHTQT